MPKPAKPESRLIPALRARTHFGKLLRSIESEESTFVIEKRGVPRAVLLSIKAYVRLAAPEPEVLTLIGDASRRNGASSLTAGHIQRIIEKTRRHKNRR